MRRASQGNRREAGWAGQCSALGWASEPKGLGPGALQPQDAVVLGETISENSLIFDDGLQILGASAKVSGDSLGIIDESLQGVGALSRFVELGVQVGDLLLRRFLKKESVLKHADQARLNGFRGFAQGGRSTSARRKVLASCGARSCRAGVEAGPAAVETSSDKTM